MPKVYAPVRGKTAEPYMTYYQVFTGPATPFPPPMGWPDFRPPGTLPITYWGGIRYPAQILDGTSNTFLVVEGGEAVPWTKPSDLEYDEKKPLPWLGGLFSDGFHAAFCDGKVYFFPRDYGDKHLRVLITASSGDVPGRDFPSEDKKDAPPAKPDEPGQRQTKNEPPIDAKEIRVWLANVQVSPSAAYRLQAVKGLSRLLREAPNDKTLQTHVLSAVQALCRATADRDAEIAKMALQGLGLSGADVRASVLRLLWLATDTNAAGQFTLQEMAPAFLQGGPEVAGALVQALNDDDYEVRGRAAFVLASVDKRNVVQEPIKNAPPGMDNLFTAPRFKNEKVHKALVERSERLSRFFDWQANRGEEVEGVLTLLEALHDKAEPLGRRSLIHETAISMLAGAGPLGRTAIPDLFRNEAETAALIVVRQKAGEVTGPNGGRRLLAAAPHRAAVQLAAMLARDSAGKEHLAHQLISALHVVLDDPKGSGIDPQRAPIAPQAVTKLREVLRHSNEPDPREPGSKNWQDQLQIMKSVRGDVGEGELLRTVSPWPNLRSEAARALGRLGAGAKEAVPELQSMLKDKDEICRFEAARALPLIDSGRQPAVLPVLKDCLRSRYARPAIESALVLLDQNVADRNVFEALLKIYGAREAQFGQGHGLPPERNVFLKQLSRLSPATQKKLCDAGRPLLQSDDAKKRRTAAWLLAPFDADACLPVLLKSVKDDYGEELAETARCLARLGPKARTAFEPLRARLEQKGKESAANDWSASKVNELFAALAQIDAEAAVPILMKAWREPPQSKDKKDTIIIMDMRWSTVQYEALHELERLGPQAKSAIPTLLADLKAPPVETDVVLVGLPTDVGSSQRLLARIGPAAVRGLLELTEKGNTVQQIRAAQTLALMRADARAAIPALLKLAAASEAKVRREAAHALGRIDPSDDKVVAALRMLATDQDVEVRRLAVRALGGAGKVAVATLSEALKDADGEVCRGAAAALGGLGTDAVPPLQEALRHKDVQVRLLAVLALAHLGPETPGTIAALIDACGDRDRLTRRLAVSLLDQPGGDAAQVAAVVAKALSDEDADVRWTAAFVLEELAANATKAVPALISALADPDRMVRRRVLFTLRAIGPSAESAVPAVKKILAEPQKEEPHVLGDELDTDVVATLRRIAPDPVSALVEVMRSADPRGRQAAAQTLTQIGSASLPALRGLTESGDADVRVRAIRCMAEIGGNAETTVPHLIRLLDDRNILVRKEAITALGAFGPKAKGAIDALKKIAADKQDLACEDTARAL